MTREQARQQLEGTWNFEVCGSTVRVNDDVLLAEIARLSADEASRGPARNRNNQSVISNGYGWSVRRPAAGEQLFN